jgi:O-antigen/teichoic acid export membrane protein
VLTASSDQPAPTISRRRSFLGGAFFGYLYQACVLAVGLWLTPFYIRTLGTHDYGVWLVALQVLTLLLLCDFGVLSVLPRDVARESGASGAGHSSELPSLIRQTAAVVLMQTLLIAVLAVVALWVKPVEPSLRGPLIVILAVFVLSYPLRLFPAVLQGLQDLTFLGQVRVWVWGGATVLTVALLLAGARFYALVAAWCVQQVGNDLVAGWRLHRLYPGLTLGALRRSPGRLSWRWFFRGFWVSVQQVAYFAVSGADLLIIGRFFGPATVVIYSCTAKLTNVLQNQPALLAGTALPGLSHMRTRESAERTLETATTLGQAMLLLVGFIFCLVMAVNRPFVSVWIGPGFFGGMALTLVLLLNFLFRNIDYTLAIALFAFGHEKRSAIRTGLDGLVSVTLAVLLARRLGVTGVAAGFLGGVLLVGIPVDAVVLSREFGISIGRLFEPYYSYLWRIGLVAAGGAILARSVGPPGVAKLIAITAAVSGAYFLIFFRHVQRSPLASHLRSTAATLRASARNLIPSWS